MCTYNICCARLWQQKKKSPVAIYMNCVYFVAQTINIQNIEKGCRCIALDWQPLQSSPIHIFIVLSWFCWNGFIRVCFIIVYAYMKPFLLLLATCPLPIVCILHSLFSFLFHFSIFFSQFYSASPEKEEPESSVMCICDAEIYR